ncbi:hypothetical protein DMENIID0001_160940 [Sergentomyia squamirostris]
MLKVLIVVLALMMVVSSRRHRGPIPPPATQHHHPSQEEDDAEDRKHSEKLRFYEVDAFGHDFTDFGAQTGPRGAFTWRANFPLYTKAASALRQQYRHQHQEK